MNPAQAPTPSGILVIDKPLGPTSMDICRQVRRRLVAGGAPKRVKVGHGGTLDPLATGVLVILVGKATRLCESVMKGEKRYIAEIDLSAFSTTDDAEGERTIVAPPEPVPTREAVEAACRGFIGVIQQRPPAYSAIKVGGRRAYDLARRAEDPREIVLPARPVTIHAIEVEAYAYPALRLRIDCGKGVYIRSLARDLGTALKTGGMLSGLRRTRVGRWEIGQAKRPAELGQILAQVDLLPPDIG